MINKFLSFKLKPTYILPLLIITIVKLLLLCFLIHEHQELNLNSFSGITFISNDYNYFFKPVDNFFKYGFMSYDEISNYAGRVPGYWFLYFLLRLFFLKKEAISYVVLIQFLMSVIANFCFSKLIFKITKNKSAFWISLIVYSFNLFILPFEFRTMAESLSISSGIIGGYYFYCYLESNKNLLLSGLFLGWMVFLRPFLFPFFMVPIFYIITKNLSISIKLKTILIFSISILVMETTWVCRNYFTMNEIILLETPPHVSYGKIYSKSWIEIRKIIHVWGGDAAYFEPNSMSQWFRREWDNRSIESVIDKSVFRKISYNENDILKLRNRYFSFINNVDLNAGGVVDCKLANDAQKIRIEFISNNFCQSHFNRWINLKRMILKSGTSYLTIDKNKKIFKPLKTFGFLYYYFFLLVGIFILLKYVIKRHKLAIIYSISFFLYILIFVYYTPILEARYFLFPHIIFIFISFIMFFKPKFYI